MRRPRRHFKALLAASALSLGATGCTYNEELGRNQFLLGGGDMSQAGQAAWNDIKAEQKVSTDPRYTERLNRVAPRIIRAAGGNPAEWEYLVFEDPTLNAFALPGGKVGIHTGIMDIMQNDAQLAAVVGHEIAHVNYNHSAERSSQGLLAQLGLIGAQIGLGSRCSGTAAQQQACQQNSGQLAQALGVGAMYGLILPYSRKHELEADAGGVRYMAAAGYDAHEALRFWQNMASASEGQERPPEFASTHPATETRIAALQEEVAQIYGEGGAPARSSAAPQAPAGPVPTNAQPSGRVQGTSALPQGRD
ncbi:M48 family metallopeptidase [Parvularcula dongshanensis]|uniref:Putative Zn-dependent protease n=1 Tax=Parvularcula dongshanensis TaxID=1173995 RepID=A0A840I3H4_9PROT|nr:M48 family metallopeptidase [Parvularcula dongshanensis]MBB4659409.1 putative Zn-dependent protease [Parvularcula dongshanensis]